eukprot:gene12352-12486_t
MSAIDVLVVGGGLGGLALAIGLQNLHLDWLLCEAASELRTATGTLIGLGSNGFSALDGINPTIVPKLKEQSQLNSSTRSEIRNAGPQNEEVKPLVSPQYTIRWAGAQNVLASLVDKSRVLCGHKCTGYSVGPDQLVTVHFQGQPDIRARLVVGADGVRSAIRGSLAPHDKMRYLGFMNWNALRHVPGSSSEPGSDSIRVIRDGATTDWNTFVMLINAGCDHKFWQVRIKYDHPCYTDGVTGGGGVSGSKARVLQHIRQLGWEDVAQEIEATDEAAIFERATWDRAPLPSWSAAGGRVLLLGDAAHAIIIQGARVLRATFVQNYAASIANLPQLTRKFAEFWQDLDKADDITERFKAFAEWMNSYPDNPQGLPGSRFTSPEVLQAYNQHCADVAARIAAEEGLAVGSNAEFV